MSQRIIPRLRQLTRTQGRRLEDVKLYYAIERFLYRLSKSQYSTKFYLKGAQMFRIWTPDKDRFTQDIDFLVKHVSNSHSNVERIIKNEICLVDNPNKQNEFTRADGMVFRWGSKTRLTTIQFAGDYHGIRLKDLEGVFTEDGSQVRISIDFGFNDCISEPDHRYFPTLLEHKETFTPKLYCYPPELTFAEKLVTMVEKGENNSRAKDFYDLYIFINQNESLDSLPSIRLDLIKLKRLINEVFQNKGIKPVIPEVLLTKFKNKERINLIWEEFVKGLERARFQIDHSIKFDEVLETIRKFVETHKLTC